MPTMTFGYGDRCLPAMLEARQTELEQHGLMGLARETSERIQEIRQWQLAHQGDIYLSSLTVTTSGQAVQ